MKNKFIELMPESLKNHSEVIKLGYVIDNHLNNIDNIIDKLTIYSRLDDNKLESVYVDALAKTFHLLANESYRFANTDDRKRELVRNALILHKTKGTKYAVERVCNILELKQAKLTEWFEDNAEPYTFKINANAFDGLTAETVRLLYDMVDEFKNVRSHISVFEFNMCANGYMNFAPVLCFDMAYDIRQYYSDLNIINGSFSIKATCYYENEINIRENHGNELI